MAAFAVEVIKCIIFFSVIYPLLYVGLCCHHPGSRNLQHIIGPSCEAYLSHVDLKVQLTHGLSYESMASKSCMRRFPFALKMDSTKEANVCPSRSLKLHTRTTFSRNSLTQKPVRRRRSLLLPGLPLLPPLLLPPIIPKIPLLPLPLLPPPLLRLKTPLKPLKVPILGKRSVLTKPIRSKLKSIKVPGLDLKAGKRRILDHLMKLKRKGSLTTAEYLRFRKLLLR